MGKTESKTRVRIGLIALFYALALLPIVIFAVARSSGPTKEQAAALKLLELPPPPEGRNAFAALWLIGYPVPEAELEDVLARDVKRFRPWQLGQPGFESVAARRHEQATLKDEETARVLCAGFDRHDCVARILADPAPQRALVARHADLIERYRRLDQYSYVRSPFPANEVVDQTPRIAELVALVRTQDVLALADGDPRRALSGLCRSVSTSRRLLSGSATILDAILQVASVEMLARDTGEVLARLPRDTPVPPDCTDAFAPPTMAELSFCNASRGEFLAQRLSMERAYAEGAFTNGRAGSLTFDLDSAIAQNALLFAPPCSAPMLDAVAHDRSAPASPAPPRSLLYCADHLRGCMWEKANGGTNLHAYQRRQQDLGAHMRMLGAAVLLRSQPDGGRSLQQRLDTLPTGLRSDYRKYEAVSGRVRIKQFRVGNKGEALWFELPSAAFLGSDGG